MKTDYLVDLHMHSRASDGTDEIPELLSKVRAAGIRVFSVTDHDTIEGAMQMEKLVPKDMRFIPGIEFSCITKADKCHILAYGYHREQGSFESILRKGHNKRRNKLRRRLDFMRKEFGIELSGEEVERLMSSSSVGKPHLGNLLVSLGYAETKNEAINKYINPCKTESDRLDAGEVIEAIRSAGGIPVWAHPFGGTSERERSEEEFEEQLQILTAAGLMGLECYYSKYTKEQVAFLTKAAAREKLLVSGGSDYHGSNKTVQLGSLNSYEERVEITALTVLDKL
ncbi:MAG: PHP domain-containing protein [Lachnospiraceae bacterium]|nr:PHP domain-containing protein [Lachnospiraceae bacterium]